MIGYRITRADLESLIEDEEPGWLAKAQARTQEFLRKGHYEESSTIWSEVKPVYMRLQGNCKCAYCERKLESISYGTIEQDVEHFRPKSNVRQWKLPKNLAKFEIPLTDAPGSGQGYYLLPYHPFNYAAACKPCNSALKRDYFPIAGTYQLDAKEPPRPNKEKPYLLYPIGDVDDDPENLIRFHGVSPTAVAPQGYKRFRALVTIEFFKLDDGEKRKNLFRERAMVIVALYPSLRLLASGVSGDTAVQAQRIVDGFTAPNAPHCNCARSLKRLFETDTVEAGAVFDAASRLIVSIS